MTHWITKTGLLVLGLYSSAFGQGVHEIRAAKSNSPPIIDGKLNEWHNREAISGFKDLQDQPLQNDSDVWISYDQDHLYVAAFNSLEEGSKHDEESFTVYLGTSEDKIYRFSVSTDDKDKIGEPVTRLACTSSFMSARDVTKEGWSTEISIPVKNLDYQNNSNFSVVFVREVGTETFVWPKMDSLDFSGAARVTQLYLTSKPDLTPLIIANAEDTFQKYGLILRKALEETESPDAPNLSFDMEYSYAEQDNPDSPFLIYGEQFLPFSRAYPRSGNLSLETRARGTMGGAYFTVANDLILGGRNDLSATMGHSLGELLSVNSGVSRRREGDLENTVTQAGIEFKKRLKRGTIVSQGAVTHSVLDEKEGSFMEGGLQYIPQGAQPRAYVNYKSITDQYHPLAGYVPETDVRGFSFGLEYTVPKTANLEKLCISVTGETLDHLDGTFLRDNGRIGSSVNLEGLPEINLSYSQGETEEYNDHLWNSSVMGNTNFGKDTITMATGEVYGQTYRSLSLLHEVAPFTALHLVTGAEYVTLEDHPRRQYTEMFVYQPRNGLGLFSGKIVSTTDWTNGYLSYSLPLKGGLSLSTILGDPYATEFTLGGSFTLAKKLN